MTGVWRRVRSVWKADPPRTSDDDVDPEVLFGGEMLPRPLVVEALARQRALAEQRLRRMSNWRELEQGRRMAIIEVAKELGIHDDVTQRAYELRRR